MPVQHYPRADENTDEPMHEDSKEWLDHSDAHYTRTRIELPEEWKLKNESATHYIVELIYGTERGGKINIWEDSESSLEHIWKPTTHNDEKYRKVDEVNFWDWENAHAEYGCIEDAGDVVDLMSRNA